MPCRTGRSDIRFWMNVPSSKITSRECLSEVRSLLNCASNIAFVRTFRGSEAQMFVDFLDQVLVRLRLDNKLRQRSLRLIRKMCKARKILPSSYILREECIQVGEVRFYGGTADVSYGEYEGSAVAIKRLKMSKGGPDRIFKRLCQEIIAWKHLSHPNILPLLGVSVSTRPYCFCILTEWMPNGNIMQYAESNPAANRLQLLSEVMSGVTYLHDVGIVHGDLKGLNILVDGKGAACLADFGLMTMADLSAFFSETAGPSGGTCRWMSPELLDPRGFHSDGRPSRQSDSYALGMVIYEVLTGLQPFHNMHGFTFFLAILRGERPQKPPHAGSLGFSDTLWLLVQACWSESSSARPTARQLLEHLSLVSPSWVPPATYPVIVDYSSSTTNSELSDTSKSLPRVGYVRDMGTDYWVYVLVVPIVVALLFVCYNISCLFVL